MCLLDLLEHAGFFPIHWEAGTSYVRPGAHEVLRVAISPDVTEIELYGGRLLGGDLLYRGPVHSHAHLLELMRQCRTVGLAA
jgi:hypothetical protein